MGHCPFGNKFLIIQKKKKIVGSDIFVCLAIFLVLAILAISKTLQCYIQFATLLHITFVPPLCVSTFAFN